MVNENNDTSGHSALSGDVRPDVTKEDIKNVLMGIAAAVIKEVQGKTEEQLEDYWYFVWDHNRPTEWNVYEFISLLDLYRLQCRRWEEHHHGSSCLVERVRDKYLMPKIQGLIAQMNKNGPNGR